MLNPILIAAPVDRPLTLEEAKETLRVEHSDDDALIDGLIDAAVAHLDGYSGILGQALVTQTWRQDFSCFAPKMRLPFGPATEIVSVTYYDGSNVLQTLASTVYCLLTDSRGPYVTLQYGQSWPGHVAREDAIGITFKAGRAASDELPQAIRTAILMLVSHFYENREATTAQARHQLPLGVDQLLAPHRKHSL